MSRFAQMVSSGPPPGRPTGRHSESGRVLTRLGALVVVLAVIGAAYLGLVPGLRLRESSPPDRQRHEEPSQSGPGLSLERPAEPALVLVGMNATRQVSVAKLERLLTAELHSPRLGKRAEFAVAPLGSTQVLWSVGGRRLATPASTMKLLTTVSALSVLGPDHRFATKVTQGTAARRIVLVGGGDPLLTGDEPTPRQARAAYPEPASLQQLAARTAQRLARAGIRRVSLGYDDSLFTGPAVNPRWQPNYVPESVVSPISALWVDEGRARPGLLARVRDPARVAAQRFSVLLSQQGVDVAPTVGHVRAPVGAATLAQVESAPLSQLVEHIVEVSDNEGAEVLLRQLAIAAGQPGSSKAGVRVVRRTLTGLGLDLSRAVLYDGSGLSRHDRLPLSALVDVLELAADPDHPVLRTVITSLPVAGFSGSLEYRFVDDAPTGLGVVRAKTGTLTGVHALAGLALTRDNLVLVFVALADRVPVRKTFAARAQLDRIAATLATCGC